MSKHLPPELDKKYAKLWVQTLSGKIPRSLKPFTPKEYRLASKLTANEKRLYSEALWKLLEMMAEDGLISRAELRAAHNKQERWEPGTSLIDSGYVPDKDKS